jgi:hypothetical protein
VILQSSKSMVLFNCRPSFESYTMILAKLFETSDFDEEIFKGLIEFDVFVEDGTGDYVVGYFVQEATNNDEHEAIALWTKFDDWLKEQGAVHGEKILIHHGSFDQFPDYLMD